MDMTKKEITMVVLFGLTILSFQFGFFYSIPLSWLFKPLTFIFGGLTLIEVVLAIKNR